MSREETHGAIAEHLLEGCQIIDRQWRYVYVNEAVLGHAQRTREELIGRTMMECFPGIDQTPMFAQLRRCMNERVHCKMLNEFDFPDGSKGWFELSMVPVQEGACVLSIDVTQTRRVEAQLAKITEQLRHAQKMEAVGRLAGGVAHDFNNLLTVVMSYADLVLSELRPESSMAADITEIRRAAERAMTLTRQLLTFSRQQPVSASVLSVNQVLDDTGAMLTRVLGENVSLKIAASKDLWDVRIDRGHLEQVLMNLVVNARDAMPRGGKLTIETKNVELDDEYAAEHLDVTPGDYVLLAISDTGVGFDRETASRLFEPFFTTKEAGKGTGLGLSTVYGIVKQADGHLWVYGEPNKGATFKIYLPRHDPDAAPSTPTRRRKHGAANASIQPDPAATETILIVEDDEQVRAVAKRVLSKSGYRVLVAASAEEARALAGKPNTHVDLLVTDVVLPGVGGVELAREIAGASDDLKVLFMSGYTDEAVESHGLTPGEVHYLQKPLTPKKLLDKVREVLR